MNTMTATVFDTLMYAKKLQAVGFTAEQAETQAECMAEILDSNVATKKDLKELEAATKKDLKELEAATKKDLKELEATTKRDLRELADSLQKQLFTLETKLTIRMGVAAVAIITLLTAILKL
jgi:hypothetical protein